MTVASTLPSPLPPQRVRGGCVALTGHGVLLTGPSGSGKSDLALRLIDRGATLVSDDYTLVTPSRARHAFPPAALPLAAPPPTIAGRIEVRGLGLLDLPWRGDVPLALVVALGGGYDRLPDPRTMDIAGTALPLIALDAFESSAPIKVEMALARILA